MQARPLLALALCCAAALAISACGGDDEPTLADFCDSYVVLQERTAALNSASDADLEERKEALGGFVSALDDLSENSPEEVKPDVEESAEWARGAQDAVAGSESVEDLETEGLQYTEDNPQPEKASQEADDFARENCEEDEPAEGGQG